ncbi:hypothetical protein BTVI_156864 [Pitangus sulphuratus]|nr:hypothetical protein BTVI_156864 [Pitangus sulphuratus]
MVSTTDIADPQSTSISGLMDPGADVTIIAKKDWPGTWSLTPTLINISGVGGSQFPLQSNAVIRITGPEDRSAAYPFHICHTRSHTTLPGPVAEGNRRADQLAGVIDADYTGRICVMVYTLSPPVFIPKGQKIAQLVPFKGCVPAPASRDRGEGGFESTGQALVNLAMDITKSQPRELSDEPDVETMCQWRQSIAENFKDLSDVRRQPTRSKGRTEGDYKYSSYEDNYEDRDNSVSRDYRDTPVKRSRPQARPQPQSWSRSRSTTPPPTCRRKGPKRESHNQLWSYLRKQGENMKKWDRQPTSKLQVRVKELKRKEANKKLVFVVDADFVEKQLQSPQHKKGEVHFPDNKKAAGGAKRTL